MSLIVGEIIANIRGDTRPLEGSLSQAMILGGNFGSQFGGTIKSIGSSLTGLGTQLTKSLTLPFAAATTAIFKFGKDFEKELSKVVGLVGIAQDQVNDWGNDILDLAPEVGRMPRELAEALFFVTSAGIKGAEAMDVLEMSAKAATAGLGETSVIADLVTSAMNAYGVENLSASRATDILVAAVREGKAEASELSASMGQVLPIASEMGVSFDQVGAAIAGMTRTGTKATEASTQLKAILSGLIKPAEQAEKQLEAMGTSSAEMRKKIREEGLIAALSDLREMTNKYGEEAMARVFPNIRALMGVLDLMGSNAEDNIKIFDSLKESTGMLDSAFESASNTLDFRWNKALSQIQATAIKFFDVVKSAMIPVLERFTDVLGFVTDKLSNLSLKQQQAILGFGALVAAVGPLIAGLGIAITALGGIIMAVSSIVSGFGTALTVVGAPALIGIAAAVGVVIGAFSAMVAAITYLWKTNDTFRSNVLKTWSVIKENMKVIISEIRKTVSWGVDTMRKWWKEHGDTVNRIVDMYGKYIVKAIKFYMTMFKDAVGAFLSFVRGDWSSFYKYINHAAETSRKAQQQIWNVLKRALLAIWNSLKSAAKQTFKDMISGMKSALNAGLGPLKSIGKNLGKYVINGIKTISFYQAGKNIISSVISGIKSQLGYLKNVAQSMASTIRNQLPFSPAKEGPLRDINKLNFHGPIIESLEKAKSAILQSFLGDLIFKGLSMDLDTSSLGGGAVGTTYIFPGDFTFNGVNDIEEFMDEMHKVTMRHTGRVE